MISPTERERECSAVLAEYSPSDPASLMECINKAFCRGWLHGADDERARTGTDPIERGGSTVIQKVEIVVTSNQNPSRIAQAVRAALERTTALKVKVET